MQINIVNKYNMNGIYRVFDVYNKKNKLKIQFIVVLVNEWEFIKNNFDFDFCKCGYYYKTK